MLAQALQSEIAVDVLARGRASGQGQGLWAARKVSRWLCHHLAGSVGWRLQPWGACTAHAKQSQHATGSAFCYISVQGKGMLLIGHLRYPCPYDRAQHLRHVLFFFALLAGGCVYSA